MIATSAPSQTPRHAHTAAAAFHARGDACGLPELRLHFWLDARGEQHIAAVHSLIQCPAMPAAVALLVRRDALGRREVRAVQHLDAAQPSLNLAQVRHNGACLGANEVHLLMGARTAEGRDEIARALALAHEAPYIA